jgi:hypothetical protein
MMHLYVIGNGFDLHHKIPSSYTDFKNWLENNDLEVFTKLEELFSSDDKWWNEFESNLGKIPFLKSFTENIAFVNRPNYLSDDYRDRDLYDAENEVKADLGNLIALLKNDFYLWAKNLPLGERGEVVQIEKDAFFLTFNYTLTLEKLYGIPAEKILHIHGVSLDKNSIIIGHGREYDDIRNDLDDALPEPPDDIPTCDYESWFNNAAKENADDYPTKLAKDASADIIYSLKKNVRNIIDENRSFFQSLSDVETIHIFGFSFSETDLPYLLELLKCVNVSNLNIEVSWHNDEDKSRMETFFKRIHYTKPIQLIRLEDIKRNKIFPLFE